MTTDSANAGRRKRRGGRAGGEARQEASAADTSYKQPYANVPTYDILTEEQVLQVHDKTMQILEEGGIAFIYDEAIDILRKHGAKIHNDYVVTFDRELVMEYLSKVPSQYTWSARDPNKDVILGDKYACFAPVAGPPFVQDIEHGRRPSTHEDYLNFLKLSHMTPYLHTSGAEIVVPSDIPITERHLETFYSNLTHSDKPTMGIYHTGFTGADSVAMAKIVFGEQAMREKHYLHCIVNVSSPRRLDDRMLSLIIEYASANQIVNVTPFILSGAMGPVSILGTVAQLNAETIAGIIFAQMVNEGTPCVYGSFQSVVDLQSGAPVMGAPESQIALYMSAQMARHYKIPFRAAGNYASSKITDAQAAYESAISIGPSMLSQPNFILHAAGWLESGLTAGYEKFVLDLETLGMYDTFLRGINWDDDQWAMDAIINEVKPGGHFLGSVHTMKHFKTAFYRAELFDYDAGETWQANGALNSEQRANKKYKEMLTRYEKPHLDDAIEAELRDYIERRKPEITTAMIVG